MPMGKISFGRGILVPSRALMFSKAKSAYLKTVWGVGYKFEVV